MALHPPHSKSIPILSHAQLIANGAQKLYHEMNQHIRKLKKISALIKNKGGFFHVLNLSTKKLKSLGPQGFIRLAQASLHDGLNRQQFLEIKKKKQFWTDHFQTVTVGSPLKGVVHALRPLNENDFSIEIPFTSSINSNLNERVGICVVLHAFYTDISESIIDHLHNIPYKYDLYISTDTSAKKDILNNDFKSLRNANKIEVRVLPNRGRDIAPKLVGFSDIYANYDYFLHLHTKKSPHGGAPLSAWRDYLFDNLLGSREIVISALELLQRENIGVVFPQHLFDLRGVLNWGYDFDRARQLLSKMGVSIDSKSLLEFPSGSMFWGRTQFLKPWIDLGLTFDQFDEEAGQIDGTLAHSIERSYLFSCAASGTTWLKTSCKNVDYKKTALALNPDNFTSVFNKVYRPLTEDYGDSTLLAVNRLNPQCARFIKFPSLIKKPRLNLLIPTVNKSQMFGGVNTAIKIFEDLMKECSSEYDFRVIATDAPFFRDEEAFFKGFDYNEIGNVEADHANRQVIDASFRDGAYLFIRENDIFLSTAWWTADLAKGFARFQKTNFGHSKRSIYLIQDYEPCFYPWSSNWALAKNTYDDCGDTIAIFNSEELYLYFSNFAFSAKYILPYTPNQKIINSLSEISRKKLFLIYGRPSVSRNCFEILVDSIHKWQLLNPIESEHWEIISLGENYPASWVPHVRNFSIKGKVTLEQYGHYLSQASIGLSLMISPHPSYPPLEMARAGMLVITNDFDEKNLALRSDNIISIKKVDVDEIATAIEKAVEKINNGFPYPCTDITDLKLADEIQLYDPSLLLSDAQKHR